MKKKILCILLASMIITAPACQAKDQSIRTTATAVMETKTTSVNTEPSIKETPKESSDALPTASTASPNETTQQFSKLVNTIQRKKNQYDLAIKLNDEAHQVEIDQKLTYVNNTGTDLKEIHFNMIPEAFRSKGGGVTMHSVTASGESLTMKQIDTSVYSLPLAKELKAGESIDLDMKYTVSVPQICDRFGYEDKFYNLGNIIATPALFENGKWLDQPYMDLGDAFYTEIADYTATYSLPEGFTVASTGSLKNGKYVATDVRDFAFSIGYDMDELHDTIDDVDIHVLYNKAQPNLAEYTLKAAKEAVHFYNSVLGGYPYESLSVVLCSFKNSNGAIAMEYPQLVMVGSESVDDDIYGYKLGKISKEELLAKNKTTDNDPDAIPIPDDESIAFMNNMILSHVANVAHEIAHQWLYGIVGNDEVRHPWIDEGMTRFMECYFLHECNLDYPEESLQLSFNILESMDEDYIENAQKNQFNEYFCDLNKSLYDYKNNNNDYWDIYDKGASMMYHFYKTLGKDAFNKAMKEYVETFAFTEVDPQEFKDFWKSKGDFEKAIDLYLMSK
ncbi:MAG: M1 family metallopeptidase [Clostridiales bacterium]|nr:M1 family metallopeptidase [Clostridiales bacterium]